MNKTIALLTLFILCSCFNKKSIQIEEQIIKFFNIVYIQKDINNNILWNDLLYFPENIHKDKCIELYKSLFEGLVDQNSITVGEKGKLKIWKYNEYPELEKLKVFQDSDTINIYILKNTDDCLYYFLIKDEKIASFVTMTKGKRNYFISCL